MAFTWTQERIRWYLDASERTDFHTRLADYIRPYVRPEDHLCDLGCGLGRVSLILAKEVARVTCVDTDPRVLAVVERDAARLGMGNLVTCACEAAELQESFDVGLMVYFGTPFSLMEACLKKTRRVLLRVMDRPGGDRPLQRRARETPEAVCQALETKGYAVTPIQGTLGFHQPLRSREEGAAFLACSYPQVTSQEIQTVLRERLEETGDGEFPYRLPKVRPITLLVVPVPPNGHMQGKP